MNSSQYIYKSRDDASKARIEARSDSLNLGAPAALTPARIKAVQAPGVYQVATLGDDGEDGAEVDGVRAFPAVDLAVDDLVWLVQWPGHPVPTILQSGGGSTCAIGINVFGVLIG